MAEKYRVLKIDEMVRVSDTGGLEKFYRHQIKTAGGVVMTVDIPEKDFTPAKVGPVLAAKAVDADRIMSL